MMKGFLFLMFFLSKDIAFGQENSCADIDSLKANAWHFHYVYNETTAAIADYFTDRFVERFIDYFPSEGGIECPFGPNYGGASHQYVCFMGGFPGGHYATWADPEWGFFRSRKISGRNNRLGLIAQE